MLFIPFSPTIQAVFVRSCGGNDIDHTMTKIKHPSTKGQVERMLGNMKDITVKRYHYDNHRQLGTQLSGFINTYN